MNVESLISFCLWCFLALVGLSIWIKRLQWRRNVRLGRPNRGRYPGTAALGNALHELQAIAQPKVKYVIEEKLDEETDEEDSGDPDHPDFSAIHLRRQANKIRRGEEVDRITTFLLR